MGGGPLLEPDEGSEALPTVLVPPADASGPELLRTSREVVGAPRLDDARPDVAGMEAELDDLEEDACAEEDIRPDDDDEGEPPSMPGQAVRNAPHGRQAMAMAAEQQTGKSAAMSF